MSSSIIIEPHYWGSIAYFQLLLKSEHVVLDVHSNFRKGTFRNRCQIMGPNGMLNLSVPLVKGKDQHTIMDRVKISYAENWRKNHWQSLISSYRRSSYFEFYEDDIAPIYKGEFSSLKELNQATLDVAMKLLKKEIPFQYTEQFIAKENFEGQDFRDMIHPNVNKIGIEVSKVPYQQVFMDRMEFLPNLSILDLLFNLGPRALDYIQQ